MVIIRIAEIRQGIEQIKRRDVQAATALEVWLTQIKAESMKLFCQSLKKLRIAGEY